jgi:cobalamin biosynthesis protein CobT
LCDDVQLCNYCVRELLILASTWFAFGLPSKTGYDNKAQEEDDEDQDDEPPQEEDIDQGGDEDDQDKEDDQEIQDQRPPHPRVHQAIERDHPVNSILGDIHKGVTTRY